ncbi:MAG: sulfur carrier protein ThiS [Bacteroidales bacterium]|nr:MAG: sulfur carrier protein ThiS [Bacteroidales bacterium]
MTVYVNDRKHSVSDICNIDMLLDNIGLNEKKGIAVAVNFEVIPKKDWENNYLKENDKILVIRATQGG